MIKEKTLLHRIAVNYQLYLILLIPTLYIVIFKYIPMLGAQIAFRNFSVTKGFWRSDWVGLYHFKRFFASYQFSRVILNTIGVSFYFMAVCYPIPIIFALSLNSTNILRFKKNGANNDVYPTLHFHRGTNRDDYAVSLTTNWNYQ